MLPEEQLVLTLKEKGWHIACAESCTGGLLCARLVDVPSASAVLDASVITYADHAKVEYLGVLPDTIAAHGVVSEPVAAEMARGVATRNHAEVGVGISGIAGPTGATDGKPVGTVCFGFFVDGNVFSRTEYFGEIGRNAVREKSVAYAIRVLNESLS